MFLDMKSSTSVAEKLGHVKYFELLRRYYANMTYSIIESSAEIYQYVGDEIILTWNLKKGLKDTACINCFHEIKRAVSKSAKSYQEDFGVIPTFKAALHCGLVTTGEIGEIKKEILYTGDTLNTTARIQGLCNTLAAELLISEDLVSKLSKENGSWIYNEISTSSLKGKNKQVKLFTATSK